MENDKHLQRITGTEMEWRGTISHRDYPDSLLPIQESTLGLNIPSCLTDMGISYVGYTNNLFLSNGARFYMDLNELREYATPEDDSFLGTTANEIANENIMRNIADTYRIRTSDEPESPGIQISYSKRVYADNNTSNGYHISYTVDKNYIDLSKPESLGLFGVFAATRSTLFGSGVLRRNGDLTTAQKTLTVVSDFSTETTRNKPVVNLRDEPLADENRFLRFHDTSADPTMSPWATRVKLGAASLVLRMIECGLTLDDLRFESTLDHVARTVALDTSLKERFRLINGQPVTALDVQRILVTHARKMADFSEVYLTDEELWTIDEWDKAIADMEQDQRLTVDRVDWTMRRAVLMRQHDRHGWAWDSQNLRYKDRQFSEVAFDGIAMALREKRWAKYMPPESLIEERMTSAPENTRAAIRQQFIEGIGELTEYATVSWSFVKLNSDLVQLTDPFQKKSKAVQYLINKASAEPELFKSLIVEPDDYNEY